jgi:CheY-like chemotaxis protein
VTGDTAPADLQVLAGTGVPVLHKPFSAEELLQALSASLPQPTRGPRTGPQAQ